MTDAQLASKFGSQAAQSMSNERIQEFVATTWALPANSDVDAIGRLL
jgi:hypothetical protein